MHDPLTEGDSLGGSMVSRPIIKDTVLATAMSTIGRGAGFMIPFLVAAWFGADPHTDAFFFAYGLVLMLAMVFTPVIESVVVPFVIEIGHHSPEDARRLVGNALIILTSTAVVVGVLFLVSSRPILAAVTNFPQESLDLIWLLLWETAPLFFLLVASSVVSGSLYAEKRFALAAVSPAIRAAVNLSVMFALRARIGVHSIALGYVCGELVRLVVLLVYAQGKGIGPSFASLGLDPRVSGFLRTALFQILGTAVLAFNPVVDKAMASWLAPGSVSILEYAGRLYEIPLTFFAGGLSVVLLSHWSTHLYAESGRAFKGNVISTAGIVGAAGLGLSLIFIFFRVPLVGLVYGHGEFPREHLSTVATLWAVYLAGLGPTLVGRVFEQGQLVLKNTKLLMIIGIVNFGLKFTLNLVLLPHMGLNGLALSTGITYAALSVVLMLYFRKASISATCQPQGLRT